MSDLGDIQAAFPLTGPPGVGLMGWLATLAIVGELTEEEADAVYEHLAVSSKKPMRPSEIAHDFREALEAVRS